MSTGTLIQIAFGTQGANIRQTNIVVHKFGNIPRIDGAPPTPSVRTRYSRPFQKRMPERCARAGAMKENLFHCNFPVASRKS